LSCKIGIFCNCNLFGGIFALLAVFFNLVELAIDGANHLNLLAALFLSGGADYLKAFQPPQLHALAYLSLKLYDYGFGISLIFFGFVCLIFGYLLFCPDRGPEKSGKTLTSCVSPLPWMQKALASTNIRHKPGIR
jgi:hypothetical protein